MIGFCLGMPLAAAIFELRDFPPVFGLLDAHACWHISTALLTPLWWLFVVEDFAGLAFTERLRLSSPK